ncbi:MAG: FtsX-like permease family protein [Phycisphaeraceae bacterium]|nr:FtsX-like permease family protein [Phycisphaerales bacterium]QOJ18378.1 MAG: FtsX-like permease family protein [Phycisphaeraceae bacterium]
MAITNLTIIRRSLAARMFSTVTTILTVAVAVGLMLILLSMRESGQKAFERGTGNMHLLVTKERDRLVSVLHAIFYTAAPGQYMEWREYQSILDRYAGAGRGPGALEYAIPVQQGDTYRGFPVTATTSEFFTRFSIDQDYSADDPAQADRRPWRFAEGRPFQGEFEVVLGSQVARRTNLRIGDIIHMTHGASTFAGDTPGAHVHDEYDWRVVGILEPTGSAHDRAIFSNIVSSWIVHAHDRLKRERTGAFTITEQDLVDDDRKITSVLLRARVRPGRQMSTLIGPIAFELNREFTVAEPRTEVTNLFRIVGNIGDILLGMAVVVMVSSGIAILLALYNSMEQRRRQIAVLRVLGCSQRRMFFLVVSESAAIGLGGALAGLALCVPASQVVSEVMMRRLGVVVEPSLDWPYVAPVLAGTVLLACVAGIVPASVAYRTSVARNLRPAA